MSDRDSACTERIRQLKPDLQIRSIELNTEGLLNDVLIVNRELVFRFAKDYRAKAALESEAKLLQFLDRRLSLLIPQPFLVGDDVLVYPLVDGDALTRDALKEASDEGRMHLAEQLGRFLFELHGVAGRGDPANDLAMLLHAYGATTVNLILVHYPEGRSLLKRARFYSQAIELE